jgi:hypothetical protein
MSTLGQSLWDSGMEARNQGYSRQRVLTIAGSKVRLSFYRDSYAFQSHYTAEVFDGNKWNPLVGLPGSNFPDVPSKHATLEAREAAVEGMFDQLLEAAEAVLR